MPHVGWILPEVRSKGVWETQSPQHRGGAEKGGQSWEKNRQQLTSDPIRSEGGPYSRGLQHWETTKHQDQRPLGKHGAEEIPSRLPSTNILNPFYSVLPYKPSSPFHVPFFGYFGDLWQPPKFSLNCFQCAKSSFISILHLVTVWPVYKPAVRIRERKPAAQVTAQRGSQWWQERKPPSDGNHPLQDLQPQTVHNSESKQPDPGQEQTPWMQQDQVSPHSFRSSITRAGWYRVTTRCS